MLKAPTAESLSALRECRQEADRLYLPARQLDKKLYGEVKRVLSAIGGEWNISAQAFVFEDDYRETLRDVLAGGDLPLRNPTAFFPTQPELAGAAMELSLGLAKLRHGAVILEPSCGRAALADAALKVRPDFKFEVCEIDPYHRAHLSKRGFTLIGDDFMSLKTSTRYDGIVMNPPFSLPEDKHAWVTHTNKALDLLADGGVLIAILPDAIAWRTTKAIDALRERVKALGGAVVKNDKNAFKESGTMAGTCTVIIGGANTPELRAKAAEDARLADEARELAEADVRVAGTVPVGTHADEVKATNEILKDIKRTPLLLPNAKHFSDLFSRWGRKHMDPSKVHLNTGTYICGFRGPYEESFYGDVRPEVTEALKKVMLDGYRINFELVAMDDGWTRVFAKYDQIIGDRWVAVVETRSIALTAVPVPVKQAA